jgi:hypothetical protein
MNFIKITLLFAFVLVFISCNEDEDNLDPDIIGEWQVVEFWDDIVDLDNIYDVQGVNEPVEMEELLNSIQRVNL